MKTAAIWWRVSTDEQREISPDTQIGEALAVAEQEGYSVPPENVIGTDWSSLSVWESPTMGHLKALVMDRGITAIFMYDADRGPSKPVHRLMFRALCEENGVAVRCCHGEIPGGEMGELMEFISAWSKEKQVHRAQQGAKDGLRDRARVKGLPIGGRAPYGYKFEYELRNQIKTPVALVPKYPDYYVVARIWSMVSDGVSAGSICRDLVNEGITAPKGGKTWRPSTMSQILTNPVYGGRYYALRHEVKEPVRRRKPGETYGKTSARRKLLEDACWLKDFPVVSPIVAWDAWQAVQARLSLNKLDSQRTAKRFYLLSGLLFCGTDKRRLAARTSNRGNYFYYRCPLQDMAFMGIDPCGCPSLNGPAVEETVWNNVSAFLSDPNTFVAKLNQRQGADAVGEAKIKHSIGALERKLINVDQMEAELVSMKLRGQVSDEAFNRNSAYLRAERTHHQEEIDRQKVTLETLSQSAEALTSIEDLRNNIAGKLESATPEDKRWVLRTLGFRGTVTNDGLGIELGVPSQLAVPDKRASIRNAQGFKIA
jgi:site-specific DNA recombinase